MAGNPDSVAGPRYEEAVIWEEQTSDPAIPLRQQYVQGKGLVILEDGVVRGVGEGRENVWQPPVDDRDVDTPPGSPSTGYRVIVGDSPTGDFAGHAGELAQWNGTAWVFTEPKQGMILYVRDESEQYKQASASAPWSWGIIGGALPAATEIGQILISKDGSTFTKERPLVSGLGGIITNNNGHMVVQG